MVPPPPSNSMSSLLQTPQSQSAEYTSAPKSWLTAFLQRTAAFSVLDRKKLFEEVSSALENVLTPAEQHRNDFCYLELWVIYLELHFELFQDEDECRRLWKYLKGTHCGTTHALFYLQFAVFEMRSGHPDRAQVVIASGLEGGGAHLLSNNEQLKLAQLGTINTASYLQRRLDEFRLYTPPPSLPGYTKPTMSTIRRLGLGPPKRVTLNEPELSQTDKPVEAPTPDNTQNNNQTEQFDNTLQVNNTNQQSLKSRSIKVNSKQYRVLSLVGKGGSSRVFKVMSNEGQVFALKRVNLKNLDDFTFNSYLNEIDLLQRFTDANCQHIIKLIDSEVNRQSGHLMILMEYGEVDLGKLLKERVRDPQGQPEFDLHFVKFYFSQMLKAIQSVHDAKIVHCDLKPANFLLVQGTLKLIDFGISKAILNDTTNIVRENQVGTVNYMSPEALSESAGTGSNGANKLKIGRSSDIWSLGCILYEMVYGAPPFASFPSLVQRLKHIMDPNYNIPIPTSPDVHLDDLLARCLTRNPKERPSLVDIEQHRFMKPQVRAITVTREQIQELLRKWAVSKPRIEESDVERISGIIYDQWK